MRTASAQNGLHPLPVDFELRPKLEAATYEQILDQDPRWALSEGSLFFEEKGAVQESLRRITLRLDELGISYALAGGMALFMHGYRRFTEDVDILVTRDGLRRIHRELAGRGYLRPFEKSKNLRDTTSKVKIEFLVTGEFPGDGLPKEIAFPDPSDAAEMRNGLQVLKLTQLINLKLASGMTGAGREKDLVDVTELIKLLNLPEILTDQLHPFVRAKYQELWQRLHQVPKRYLLLWRDHRLPADAKSIDDLITQLGNGAELLAAMRDAGIWLDPDRRLSDGAAHLLTTDPDVAKRFGMEDESEYWGLDDSNPTPG